MAEIHDHAMRGERERRGRVGGKRYGKKKMECKTWKKRICEAERDNSGQRE